MILHTSGFNLVVKAFFSGANVNSWSLILEIKGKVEESVKNLGFKQLSIYRPGLLLTQRPSETRMLESLAQSLAGRVDTRCKVL